MKYRAKKAICNTNGNQLTTIGKIYDIEEVNTITKYQFKDDLSQKYYISEGVLDKYFEKVEESMKFKVGDKVSIRKDLQTKKWYGKNSVTNKMLEYLGKSANIVKINSRQEYLLDIDNGYWGWTDEMLEPVQSLSFDVNKYIGKAIHCDTEDKANQLLDYLDGQGYKWNGDRKIKMTEENNWKGHSENTCYRIYEDKTITYASLGYFSGYCFDIIEFDDLLTSDKPRMCEIIGRKIGEEFIIKNYFGNPCYINKLGEVRNSQGERIRTSVLTRIINHPKQVEDIPTKPVYTDKQLEIFRMLKDVFHLNFVARDKASGNNLFGYVNKPKRILYNDAWEFQLSIVELSLLDKDIFAFVKWEDEPFDLAKALESIEK